MILLVIFLELFGLVKLLAYVNNSNDFINTCKKFNTDYGTIIFTIVILDAIISIAGGAYILYNCIGI